MNNTYRINGVTIWGKGKMKDGRPFLLTRKWDKWYRSFDDGETWELRKKVKL